MPAAFRFVKCISKYLLENVNQTVALYQSPLSVRNLPSALCLAQRHLYSFEILFGFAQKSLYSNLRFSKLHGGSSHRNLSLMLQNLSDWDSKKMGAKRRIDHDRNFALLARF